MVTCKHLCLIFCAFFFIASGSYGQGYLRTQGKAIVNASGDTVLLRGMGLGGWMLQEGYMLKTAEFASAQYQIRQKIEELIGAADTELFYEAWLANHVRKIDIDSLNAWGFNSVRLPMHYNLFTLPVEEEPVSGENTWLDKGFILTDSLISWCAQNQMYVILDLHAAPGGQGYDQGISDYDPTKPSLWESEANQDKTVALWARLAERYADEPWVAGYDLINETNWDMDGNGILRFLYGRITNAIRAVDGNHIIFIEGNWFANDFTGLTPPWDDNMVYSPHKYWSFNDPASIQWVLDIREQHNVPLYLGESGENSNVWFRNAIRLLEDHGIGWAWWPMKKVDEIDGPLNVIRTAEYQTLLDYWNGNGSQPNVFFAKATLMELTENLKLENCIYQKDVIDAMFRQVYSDDAIPYRIQSIPGVVYASDYDLGREGIAYHDVDLATYHVSTGQFTAWNSGWSYRNDGVDIQPTLDNVNTNGFHVGWFAPGEWMQYHVDVAESAVFDVDIRAAGGDFGGSFHFMVNDADVSRTVYVPFTGGFQNWQTVTLPDMVLTPEDKLLRFYVEGGGFNVNSFEFIQKGATTSIPAKFVSASIQDQQTIQVNFNKPMLDSLPSGSLGFQVLVNGIHKTIVSVSANLQNPRIYHLTLDHVFNSEELIKMSYFGNAVKAVDGTDLKEFALKDVRNTLPVFHAVPGRVQAEDFFTQTGMQLENTFDIGGGQHIAFLDVGDFAEYFIDVAEAGTYSIDFRNASLDGSGEVRLYLVEEDQNLTFLHATGFSPTGDWQNWVTTTGESVYLPSGTQKLRMEITKPQFNLNWFEFSFLTSTQNNAPSAQLKLYPNPGTGVFFLEGTLGDNKNIEIMVYDLLGQPILSKKLKSDSVFRENLDLSAYPDGTYLVAIKSEDDYALERIMKIGH